MVTLCSNRILKETLPTETVEALDKVFEDYNSSLHSIYKTIIYEARHPEIKYSESLFIRMTKKFPDMPIYFLNTAIQDAKGIHSSRMALLKEEEDVLLQKLSNTENKINKDETYLNKLFEYKQMLIEKKPLVFDNKQQTFKKTPSGCIKVYRGKGKNKRCIGKYDNEYLFECLYLTPEIKKTKSRIGLITFKKNEIQKKIDRINGKGYQNKYIPAVQFGTKKLRKQGMNDEQKQQEYNQKRKSIFSVSGRLDSVVGNFAFEYANNNITLKTKTREMKKDNTKGDIVIPNVKFRYGQDIIDNYYLTQRQAVHNDKSKRKPISFTIEDKGLYYIIKCSLEEELPPLNYSKSNGVIAVDCNLGFYSVCNTNADGSLLETKTFNYEWFNKSSNQITKNIELAIKELVLYAVDKKKPLVIEDLKFKGSSKVKDYNSNNSKNFKSNMFAYKKMTEQLIASAKKNGVEVFIVSPVYTSLIGKVKYMPYYKRSIHELAALAIARRALKPKRTEKIPKRYKDKCSSWKDVYRLINKNKK